MQQEKIYETLKRWWGYDSFRAGQREVIESVCAGRDTLALMPTGAGKSLLYQLPAMMKEGVCIVVTPLIALMKDQTDALRKRGISAVAVYSGMTDRKIDIALDNCVYGDVKFLYIAPERISSDMFTMRVRKMNVSLIAVDEAHCISQWGYDFRPSYLRLARLRELAPDAPVVALTASATSRVAEDIMKRLNFSSKNIVRTSFARKNLSFVVRRTDDKRGQLMRVLESVPGSGIVYVRTRDGAEKLSAELREEGVATEFYHGGLPHGERSIRQDAWQDGRVRVMVATNAFGMGIDKADVRFVVHYDVCDSLEAYYQEAGRAGRDGRRSYAVLLAASDEKSKMEGRFRNEFPAADTIKSIYSKLCSYLQVAVGDGKFASFIFDVYDFCARNKLFRGTVVNAIKILQQNGYMVLTDEAENPARLMFCVGREDLYNIRVERRELDTVLRTILRLYEGVFTEFRPIDAQEIALYSGFTEEHVKDVLKQLWRMHVIRYVPKNVSPMLVLTEERLPEKDIYIDPDTLERRRQMTAERLERMFEYVTNEEQCRSAFIGEYFGEEDAAECGCCDVCLERRRGERAKRNATELREEIKRRIVENEFTVKELVAGFAVEPQKILAEVDELMAEGDILVNSRGIIEIKP